MEKSVHKLIVGGNYQGVNYYVFQNGVELLDEKDFNKSMTWYCAYIEKPIWFDDNGYELEDLSVHGGITFNGKMEVLGEEKFLIGWDYNHCFDVDFKKGTLFNNNIWVEDKDGVNKIILEIQEFIRRYC